MDPTLKQGNVFSQLVEEHNISRKQLQALYDSGLMSDLLKAGARGCAGRVDRNEFRELLELPRLALEVLLVVKAHQKLHHFPGLIEEDVVVVGNVGRAAPYGKIAVTLSPVGEFDSGERLRVEDVIEQSRTWEQSSFALGQQHAEAFCGGGVRIPMHWRRYRLLFPSTTWGERKGKARNSKVSIPQLHWTNLDWSMTFISSSVHINPQDYRVLAVQRRW